MKWSSKIIWLGCMMSLSLPAIAQLPELGRGLVGYYPFDGDATDRTGQGRDGFINGAKAVSDRFGSPQSAFALDGKNQSIRIPFESGLSFHEQSYSISLWIQPRDVTPGCILLRHPDYGLKWEGMDKGLTLFSGVSGGYKQTPQQGWKSKQWYHIVLIHDQTTLRLYINGQVAAEFTQITRPAKEYEGDIFLGKHPYYWGGFTGSIDDILLYNRPLEGFEIDALFQIQQVPGTIAPASSGPDADISEIAGVWQGILSQPDHDSFADYPFWVKIEASPTGIIVHTRIEVEAHKAFAVKKSLVRISGPYILLEEKQIINQKNYVGLEWCDKYGKLLFDAESGTLQGPWFADNCAGNGEILLHRTQAPFNFYDNRVSNPIDMASFRASLQVDDTKELSKQLQKLALAPIKFLRNSSQLTVDSRLYVIEMLSDLLKKYPKLRLTVVGYTDTSGDNTYNLMLSRQRAKAVIAILAKEGVSATQLAAEGRGEADPIADNATTAGRAQNRRVEFLMEVSP